MSISRRLFFRPEGDRLGLRGWFGIAGLALGCVLAISGVVAADRAIQEEPYRILVTNDDGVEAPGIQALAKELRAVGEVIVIAPAGNRSGSSQATSRTEMLRVEEHREDGRLLGHGVSGFPADAVRFGVRELARGQRIDLVVSGINRGHNVGHVAHLSGTVGAAMQAIYMGIPGVAVSLTRGATDYTFAARFTARVVAELKRRGAPSDVVLSINIPAATADELRGVAPARMGGTALNVASFERRLDNQGRPYYWATSGSSSDFEPGTDSYAYHQNMITITPLRFDWTDDTMLAELQRWELTLR